jgi:Asp/Glu/hydantoin racemase
MIEKIGIIMLDTVFPRIPGDVGNPSTFSFPVIYKVVKGATSTKVVKEGNSTLLQPIIQAAKELEEEGIAAIATSCGFLAMFHKELTNAVKVPVFTSSLLQVHVANTIIKRKQKVGILTASSQHLSDKHLNGVGIENDSVIIRGMDGAVNFTNAFLGSSTFFDVELVKHEMVQSAEEMLNEYPEIGALVLECTNMPPYAKDIQMAVNIPVFDVVTMINYAYSVVVHKDFKGVL